MDGSDLAEEILPYVIEYAKYFDARIILLMAYGNVNYLVTAVTGFPLISHHSAVIWNSLECAEITTNNYLKSISEKLRLENGLQTECVTVSGVTGPAVVKYAVEQAVDLIAIASYSRDIFKRGITAEIANYLLKKTKIPVLLIRPPKTPAGKNLPNLV